MKHCIQCHAPYEVSDPERAFLQKVMLPEPTLCPQCRMQGRFAFRNERNLYNRKCDLTGKQIISMYAPDSPYTVYDQHEWHTDKWDGLTFGRDFDFSRPFFEQFNELMRATPKISVFTSRNENSDFTNGAQQDKNCYMIFVSDHNEDCYYSYAIDSCKDSLECLNCFKCELCIECIDCSGSYNLAYCDQTHNSSDSYFLSDCKRCRDCFGCFGLRDKQYCVFNQQYSKEEYASKIKEFNLGSYESILTLKKVFLDKIHEQQIHQYYDGNNNENVTGDHIIGSKNCIECYDSANLEDCGYLIFSFNSKDCFDGHVVVDKSELCCGTISTINQYNTQFTYASYYSKNSQYIDHCQNCSNCFGCSGLKRKEYCIFNKQFTKDEYEELKSRIIEHMKSTGEWGMPFPPQLSPFGYNETVAQEYFPLTKEQVLAAGLVWRDDTGSQSAAYQGPEIELPDHISEVPDGITEKIFLCAASGKPYKIIPQELKLYRRHGLPVPRMNFDQRHLERIQRRNPRYLWGRTCAQCDVTLKTTYSPERPETIYCEACYLKAVY